MVLSLISFVACAGSARPHWIDQTPARHQALAHIQAQRGHSPSMQKRIALLQAKAELAKRKQLHIYSQLRSQTLCRDKACSTKLHTLSLQKSQEYLHAIKIVDEYFDPIDGSYYLLVQMHP